MVPMIGVGVGIGFDNYIPRPRKKNSNGEFLLYNPQNNLLINTIAVWYPHIETEMISYFSKNPAKLYEMPSRKFEELIAAIFNNHGFQVQLTPETRDGGYDILAIQKNDITGDNAYLVECKRYQPDNKIGVGIIRQLLGVVVDQKAHMGILATTSFLTKPAEEIVERNQLKLLTKDYNKIADWLTQVKIPDPV
jgi:restriction system protein